MKSKIGKDLVSLIVTSGISLTVGLAAGHIWTKKSLRKTYEALIAKEVSEAKAFYGQLNKSGDFADPVSLAEKLVGDSTDPFADEPDDDFIVVEGKPFRDVIDPSDRVNYNRFSDDYSGPVVKREEKKRKPLEHREGETMAQYEQRIIDDAKARVQEMKDKVAAEDPEYAAEMEREEKEEVVSNIFDTHGVDSIKVSNDAPREPGRPYVISVTEFTDNETQYGQNSISYYQGDDVLADERDQPIPDIEYIVGRKNLRFGDGSGDPNIVFVRNDELEVDFEVCQSLGTYAEEVLGVAPPETRSQRSR